MDYQALLSQIQMDIIRNPTPVKMCVELCETFVALRVRVILNPIPNKQIGRIR